MSVRGDNGERPGTSGSGSEHNLTKTELSHIESDLFVESEDSCNSEIHSVIYIENIICYIIFSKYNLVLKYIRRVTRWGIKKLKQPQKQKSVVSLFLHLLIIELINLLIICRNKHVIIITKFQTSQIKFNSAKWRSIIFHNSYQVLFGQLKFSNITKCLFAILSIALLTGDDRHGHHWSLLCLGYSKIGTSVGPAMVAISGWPFSAVTGPAVSAIAGQHWSPPMDQLMAFSTGPMLSSSSHASAAPALVAITAPLLEDWPPAPRVEIPTRHHPCGNLLGINWFEPSV